MTAALRLTPPGYTDLGLTFWVRADSGAYDRFACALADEHYPRRKVGADQCVPPGEGRYVLMSRDLRSVWAWVHQLYPKDGIDAWRCSIFRRTARRAEPAGAELVLDAERALLALGVTPTPALLTYVEPGRMESTNPGYCYLKAGWRHDAWTGDEHGRPLLRRLIKDWSGLGTWPQTAKGSRP